MSSGNWYVNRIQLFCGGARVAYIRGIEMGRSFVTKRSVGSGCSDMFFAFDGFDGQSYRFPIGMSVYPGMRFCIDIPFFLRQVVVVNCTART